MNLTTSKFIRVGNDRIDANDVKAYGCNDLGGFYIQTSAFKITTADESVIERLDKHFKLDTLSHYQGLVEESDREYLERQFGVAA